MKTTLFSSLLLLALLTGFAQGQQKHTFAFRGQEFLLDGKPFRITSGELHPARIPREYWQHRIRMAKAMGCNTIAAYIFWNYHETSPGSFDFTTDNRDLAEFFRLVKEEGLWLILRPGPYVCAEWDFGGIPSYLLKHSDLRIRCTDRRYLDAVERYIRAFASIVRPWEITQGGPIVMLQIENEYGSFGNDKAYLDTLAGVWRQNGIDVPFCTADGPTPAMLEAGSVPGAALGLNPGLNAAAFAEAARSDSTVPAFSAETYPGWLTHWGESWARGDSAEFFGGVKYLLESGKSFNIYVIHGGTNFGFTAGANSGGKGFEPDVTSYDYDAPITEQGRATPAFLSLRELISRYAPSLPPIPKPIPTMEIPTFELQPFSSVWATLPPPVSAVTPQTFEALDQNQGLVLYRTTLVGQKSGRLTVTELHDFALVYLDRAFVGTLDRRQGIMSIELPRSANPRPVLEILVEGMGHVNYGSQMIDRKGITDRVTLNGMTLMNWRQYRLPLDGTWIRSLKEVPPDTARRGIVFRGSFRLDRPADTYFDLSAYTKGVVWVNGHNLGRYWSIGPQQRLYCPAPWLRSGMNEILVLDLLQTESRPVRGLADLNR